MTTSQVPKAIPLPQHATNDVDNNSWKKIPLIYNLNDGQNIQSVEVPLSTSSTTRIIIPDTSDDMTKSVCKHIYNFCKYLLQRFCLYLLWAFVALIFVATIRDLLGFSMEAPKKKYTELRYDNYN